MYLSSCTHCCPCYLVMLLRHWLGYVPAKRNAPCHRVGDVCITPVSVNWVCKKSTWTLQAEGYPNQCFRPQEVAGPNATQLYGECVFATDNVSPRVHVCVCVRAGGTCQ